VGTEKQIKNFKVVVYLLQIYLPFQVSQEHGHPSCEEGVCEIDVEAARIDASN
jgi:hypothetical protein